jgi:hypothetical protein
MSRSIVGITAKMVGALAVLLVSFVLTLWVMALWDRREQILQTVVLNFSNHRVPVMDPIPLEPAKARVKDGFGLASTSFVPKDPQSILRIHIRTYIQSERLTTAVIAVFREGSEEPIRTFTRTPSSPRMEEMIALFDIPAAGTTPIGLSLRIGPADSGSIMLNGTPGGAGVESLVIIQEVKRSG